MIDLAQLQLDDDEEVDLGIEEGLVGKIPLPGTVEVEFEARGAVRDLFQCRDDEVVLSGPAGTGKSRGGLEKVHYLLSNNPRAKGLLLRKTLVSLTETGLATYNNQVLHQMDGVRFFGGSKKEAARFIYPNGAQAGVGGLDQITKVMSSDYDVIWIQEVNEVAEKEYEMLTTRLRNGVLPFMQMISDVNPQEPWHWILKRVKRGDLTMLESRHEDNPRLFNADGTKTHEGEVYLRRLDRLTGVRFLRLRKGLWVAAEGQVYEEFTPDMHVIKPFKIPAEWTRIRSIDFGFVNPFVCQFWAIDPDGRMYLYKEIYRSGTIVSDHAKQIKKISGNQYFEATIADHDSEDRATLRAEGIPTIRARKQILPGIEAVQKRLRPDSQGKPRMFMFNNALVDRQEALTELGQPTCTAEEMVSYSWNIATEQSKTPKSAKEVPLDLNNHGCDAMRYATMYLEKKVRSVAPGGVVGTSSWKNKHERDMGGR